MAIKVLFVVKEIEGAEPLGALYVAGCLAQAGHECRFVGTRGNDVADEVRRFHPHVVAFGATTGLHRYYLGLAAHLKTVQPDCLTLMGGPHPTDRGTALIVAPVDKREHRKGMPVPDNLLE